MKPFLLISIFIFVLGCASYPEKNNFNTVALSNPISNPYFANLKQDYVYKANIEVYGKNFSGILIIKKIAKAEHRLVFTTEMGNKIFDFSFKENDFKVNYIVDALNKKMLLNILKKDFKVLISEHIQVTKTYKQGPETINKTSINKNTYYYYNEASKLQKIVGTKYGKENVIFSFKNISDNIAQQIEIAHLSIKLNIYLKKIN